MNKDMQVTFACNLTVLRCLRLMNCEGLNRMLELPSKRVIDFEYQRVVPTIQELVKITETFGVTIDQILYKKFSLELKITS